LPFFDLKSPSELVSARRFDLVCEMPWYMVGANGFDLQHFRVAHDRQLVDEPVIDQPAPHAYRISARFRVGKTSWRDRVIRVIAGNEVAMTVTSWCGSLVYVTASFRRASSYGLVSIAPLDPNRARVRIVVSVPRSGTLPGRLWFDPLNAWIRRWFIRAFLRSDVEATAGITYHPSRFVTADRVLEEYLDWLARVHQDP
jgi:hypothetical protein